MAKDHFKVHYYQKDRVDWNFNILLGELPAVARMAQQYRDLLQGQTGLYEPIPPDWLHLTVLRVGLTNEYTETDMLRVANILAPQLADMTLPSFSFDSWWQWGGNIILHVTPDDVLQPVYAALQTALITVLGETYTRYPLRNFFVPHMTLAYTKERNNELATNKLLHTTNIQPVTFQIPEVALIRQWPTNGHYEWEVRRRLAIGK